MQASYRSNATGKPPRCQGQTMDDEAGHKYPHGILPESVPARNNTNQIKNGGYKID